jgi:ParB-like chromosome segregation protein Spo0J
VTSGTSDSEINPGLARGYALDFYSVVRHVANELRGADTPLPISTIAERYTDMNPGDLVRVRKYHGLVSDQQAIEFLAERAVRALGTQVVVKPDGVRLRRRNAKLEYLGRPLAPIEASETIALRDPFNPMSGEFSENIRTSRGQARDNLSELRESIREFGWIPELPAITDERGVVLIGHRRLAVARELGIEPVVNTIFFGTGDAADARRFRIAIASNIGSKPLTPDERQRIAEYLYGERDWTMARIAEALNMSTNTISKDLADFSPKVKIPRRGRPKKITPKHQLMQQKDEVVLQRIEAGERPTYVARSVGFSSSSQATISVSRAKAARYERLVDEGKLVVETIAPYGVRLIVPDPPATIVVPPVDPNAIVAPSPFSDPARQPAAEPPTETTKPCPCCSGTGRVPIDSSET